MVTCFDSTVWFSRCSARVVVKHLEEELGVLPSEEELLDFLQEALGEGGTTARQPSQQLPQKAHRTLSASQPPLSQPQPLSQAQSQLQPQSQLHSQPPLLSHQPSQRHNGGLGNGCDSSHTPQQPQQPPLLLELPARRDAGPGAGGGGVTAGAADQSAAVTVQLPPGRFSGCDVPVRLPPPPCNLVLVTGPEAQRACITLVSNMHHQLSERRDQLERAAAELTRALEENALLRNQLAAAAAASDAGGGATPWQQYGLAGAPPPLPAAAAKRQRTAPPAQLQRLLSNGLEDFGGGGGAGAGPALAAPAAAGAARGFASQPAPTTLPMPQADFQGTGVQMPPPASQAGGSGGVHSAAGPLLSQGRRDQALPAASGGAHSPRPGAGPLGVGESVSLLQSPVRPSAVVTGMAAMAASVVTVGGGGTAVAAMAAGVAAVKPDPAHTSAAVGPLDSTGVGGRLAGQPPRGSSPVAKSEPGGDTRGRQGQVPSSSQANNWQPPLTQTQSQPAVGAAGGASGAPRDPTRVGVTIRAAGSGGRGPLRGGRGLLRR